MKRLPGALKPSRNDQRNASARGLSRQDVGHYWQNEANLKGIRFWQNEPNLRLTTTEHFGFIDENGGGPGVRLRRRQHKRTWDLPRAPLWPRRRSYPVVSHVLTMSVQSATYILALVSTCNACTRPT